MRRASAGATSGRHFDVIDALGRIRLAVPDDGAIDDAVAIEKHRGAHRSRLPFRLRLAQGGVRHEQMPHDGLKGFRVRRNGVGIHHGHDNARISQLGGHPTVASDNPDNRRASRSRKLDDGHEIRTDARLAAAAADGEHEHAVTRGEPAGPQPAHQRLVPPVVIDAGGELGDVVRRRVGLEAGELAEVADRVRRVRGAAAVADDEQPAAAGPHRREPRGDALDGVGVDQSGRSARSRSDDHARTSASFPA